MAFSLKTCTLLLTIVAAVCIQLHEAQFIPGARCLCHDTIKYTPNTISDFKVIEIGPNCNTVQVIVTMEMPDNMGQKDTCLNLEGKLAMAFITCWNRINRDESKKTICLNRRKKAV